jgi:hypothetical protein
MEDIMKKQHQWWTSLGICLSVALYTQVYGHEGGGGANSKNAVRVPFAPNASVPEFAGARGTAVVDLKTGVISLEDLQGFPFDTARNRIIPVNVTSTIDPRLKGHDGEPGQTSCEQENADSPWHCHVHSYAVWLAELEDGALGHPIFLGTIYPRTDGTAADRNFSFREGDISGFGANVILITGEVSFGALPSIAHGHDGSTSLQMVPLGPIVLQANLP